MIIECYYFLSQNLRHLTVLYANNYLSHPTIFGVSEESSNGIHANKRQPMIVSYVIVEGRPKKKGVYRGYTLSKTIARIFYQHNKSVIRAPEMLELFYY